MARINMNFLRTSLAILKKDLLDECRARLAFTSLLLFAVTILVTVSFSVGSYSFDPHLHAALIWIVMFFSAMSALARGFVKEEEGGTALSLKIHASPEIIYLGKLFFSIILLISLLIILFPLYFIMMTVPSDINWLALILTLIAGLLCLAGVSTILSAIVARAGVKNALLPILAFPLFLPVLLIAIKASGTALRGAPLTAVSADLIFAFSYFVIIITASILLFPFVWED